jgi:hypothetical protein
MRLIFYPCQLQEVHCTDDHSEDQELLSKKEIKEQRVVAIKVVAHRHGRPAARLLGMSN